MTAAPQRSTQWFIRAASDFGPNYPGDTVRVTVVDDEAHGVRIAVGGVDNAMLMTRVIPPGADAWTDALGCAHDLPQPVTFARLKAHGFGFA